MILRCFFTNAPAKARQCVAMIAIADRDFAHLVTDAEEKRHGQYRRCPPKISRALLFAAQEQRRLSSDQQTERRDHGKNAVHSFGRNQRHQKQSTDAPTNKPKCRERNLYSMSLVPET